MLVYTCPIFSSISSFPCAFFCLKEYFFESQWTFFYSCINVGQTIKNILTSPIQTKCFPQTVVSISLHYIKVFQTALRGGKSCFPYSRPIRHIMRSIYVRIVSCACAGYRDTAHSYSHFVHHHVILSTQFVV